MIAPGEALCGRAWWIESVDRPSLDTEDLSVCRGRLDRDTHADGQPTPELECCSFLQALVEGRAGVT
jgi:hypothetical protein